VAGQPTALVSVIDHGLVISKRSHLRYVIFLLFLVSTLVSLLTVYLIMVRVKRPLTRLLRGLNKTTAGEMYYLIETEGDQELNALVDGFNHMTRNLWQGHEKLKASHARLNQLNISLLESQVFLATLIDNSPFAVIAASPKGQIMLANRRATEMFGHAPGELLGRQLEQLFATARGQTATVEPSEKTIDFEARGVRKNGDSFPVYVCSARVGLEQASPSAHLYILRDISESRRFQDMMIRFDRIYTRGQMASDIAHEINNYLAILAGNVDLIPIMLRKGKHDKLEAKLQLMRDTVERIACFADGLIEVPQEKTNLEQADLNQLVENMLAFIRPQNRFDHVEFETNLAADLPLVPLDPGQIQQLLLNYVFNSADALRDSEGERVVKINTRLVTDEAGRRARLEVIDNGPGVNTDKENLLFADRFTTKRRGQGIGLITCRKIAEAHGGKVGYERRGGALFFAELPLTAEPQPRPSETTSSAAATA
jgi:PAS domain S-box-containing protein